MSGDVSEDANEFRCLVPFPDGSASFVNGFEAGMVWQRMVRGESPLENACAYHSKNRAVFQAMADAQGYDATFDAYDDEWMVATFTKRRSRFAVIQGGRSGEEPSA
jgi:hypothetical protein